MTPMIHDLCFANYGKQLTCLSSCAISASTSVSPSPSSRCKGRSFARQKTRAIAKVEGFDREKSHLVAMARVLLSEL